MGTSSPFWPLKTVGEWLFSLVGCVLLAPLLLLVALLIKLTSKGPVLYLAERVGKGGSTFGMCKFRSMKMGCEKIVTADDKVITLEHDPRLTPIGGLLRKGFDELPQLFNTLAGQMSIIGPRPDEPFMLPKYEEDLKLRWTVRPGITGLAQVMDGHVLPNEYEYALDLYYIRNWTPWMDLHIALYTPLYSLGCKSHGQRWLKRIMPEAADAWERLQISGADVGVHRE